MSKIPRNFRLDPNINAKLIERGRTFKNGDRIGDTGVVEAALEAYFKKCDPTTPPAKSINAPVTLEELEGFGDSSPKSKSQNPSKGSKKQR